MLEGSGPSATGTLAAFADAFTCPEAFFPTAAACAPFPPPFFFSVPTAAVAAPFPFPPPLPVCFFPLPPAAVRDSFGALWPGMSLILLAVSSSELPYSTCGGGGGGGGGSGRRAAAAGVKIKREDGGGGYTAAQGGGALAQCSLNLQTPGR